MHLYGRTERPPRRVGEIILATGPAKDVFDVGVDGEAVTGLFPPADAVKTLQP